MGQSASLAGRSYIAADTASRAAGSAVNSLPSTGSVAVDAQRAATVAQRTVLSLAEEEQLESRDQNFGNLLDQLGGAIHGKAVTISPPERPQQHASSLPVSSGRLPPSALLELFELQRQAAGGLVNASHLVSKYKADPDVIRQVLSQVCLPEIVPAQGSAGVMAFGEWPEWFQRRNR